MSLEESRHYLKETYHLADSVERITAETIGMIRTFYLNEVALKPGVADYLRYLQEQNIPTIYLKAAQKIGTQPWETIVFEDVLQGIVSAKSIGFKTVAVDDRSNKTETNQLRKEADYFILDFTDSILTTI